MLRLIIELHIYGLVGVVTSLSVFFIEVNTTFPPPLPVFVRNVAMIFSNVCPVTIRNEADKAMRYYNMAYYLHDEAFEANTVVVVGIS